MYLCRLHETELPNVCKRIVHKIIAGFYQKLKTVQYIVHKGDLIISSYYTIGLLDLAFYSESGFRLAVWAFQWGHTVQVSYDCASDCGQIQLLNWFICLLVPKHFWDSIHFIHLCLGNNILHNFHIVNTLSLHTCQLNILLKFAN